MRYPDRAKNTARRRSAPRLESLEDRRLLSALPEANAHLISEALAARQSRLYARHELRVEKLAAAKMARLDAIKIHAEKLAQAKVLRDDATILKSFHDDLVPIVSNANNDELVPILPNWNNPTSEATPIPGLYNPTQLRTAYGVSQLATSNEGQGVTIAIIDALNDPNALSDLNVFSAEYGLPIMNSSGGPTFTVVTQAGVRNSSTNPNSANDYSGETSLDLDMAHSLAPYANILLVQTTTTFLAGSGASANGLLVGDLTAAGTPGVVAVSTSYGGNEPSASTEATYDSYLPDTTVSPNTHPVIFTFSTGDSSTPSYPALSPNVVAVGGTGLYTASSRGRYSFETAWGGFWESGYSGGAGGGGLSTHYALPSYQAAGGLTYTHRAIPDISAEADVLTAVSVYDSWDGQDWTGYGGTSVSSPIMAGIFALAQQDRIANGLTPLSSNQVDTDLYTLYNSPNYLTYFHDVTLGTNTYINGSGVTINAGYAATTGYDLATGIGSPVGNNLVLYLASH